jgi:hypothetical protein
VRPCAPICKAEEACLKAALGHRGGAFPRYQCEREGEAVLTSLNQPLFSVAMAVSMTAAGCAREHVSAVYDRDTRSAIRLDDDTDLDGRIDLRTYLQQGRAVRLEADVNSDGFVDRWEYYDRGGRLLRVGRSSAGDGRVDTWATQDGRTMYVEISTRRDGGLDRHEVYQGEVLVRTEIDTNQDGLVDQWQDFEGGRLRELRVDTGRTLGRPDRRLVYAGDGALTSIEADPEGDGRFVPVAKADGSR